MFETTIAGSLPSRRGSPKRTRSGAMARQRRRVGAAKRDATLLWLKAQEDADWTSSPMASKRASISCMAFSSELPHRLRAQDRDGYPQRSLQGNGAQVVARSR